MFVSGHPARHFKFFILAVCLASTRQDIAAQFVNTAQFETQEIEFDPVLFEGYGCFTLTLELPEPIDLTGVDNVGLDGIQIVLNHPAEGFDLIRYSAALFAEGAAQPLSGHGHGFQLLPGDIHLVVPIRRFMRVRLPENGPPPVVTQLVLTILVEFLRNDEPVPCGAEDPPARPIGAGWELMPGAQGLRIHTVRGNAPQLEPEGRNQIRELTLGLLQATDGNPTDWQEFEFDPVEGTRLAYIWAGGFGLQPEEGYAMGSGAAPEVVLLTDDDELPELRLDDTSQVDERMTLIPGEGEARAGMIVEYLAALLDLQTRRKLAETQIIGMRWRLHHAGAGTSGAGLRNTQVRFYYHDPLVEPSFLRGDCDGNGRVPGTVNDGIASFQHCFSGREVPCKAACDADGDGNPCSGVTDGLRILLYAFQSGNPPPPPFPDCGTVEGEVDCETSPTDCQ